MPGAIVGKLGGPRAHGDDDVGGLIEQFEAFGKDADDGVGLAVEGDGFAEDVGGARVLSLPEPIAQKGDGGG